MWTRSQQNRLAMERKLLLKEMPQFQFYKTRGDTYVEGWMQTSGGNTYKLRLVLGQRYPDEMPSLYVVSPRKLRKYGYGTINNQGLSHRFHTCGKGPGGCVEICHFRSSLWNSSKTILAVLTKGLIWCEGYAAYLKTGKGIAEFCK